MKNAIHFLRFNARTGLLFLFLLSSSFLPANAQCCPPDVDALTVTKNAYQFEQVLDENSPQLSDGGFCLPYSELLPNIEEPRYRQLIPFELNTDDIIIVHAPEDSTNINNALFMALYEERFDDKALCKRLVAVSNLSPAQHSDIRLAAALKTDKVYHLLITTTTPMTTGSFKVQITTTKDTTSLFLENITILTNPDWTIDTIVTVLDYPSAPHTFSLPLNCGDAGLIFDTELELTGDPSLQTGCSGIENLTYQDETDTSPDCAATFIERTFTYDSPDNQQASCSQLITLNPVPGEFQKGIWLPPASISVDCGFPCNSNNYPSPEETGSPFVLTVNGPYLLDGQSLCNLPAATYEDSAPIEACETYYTFMRSWTIADPCQSQGPLVFEQRIQVGTTPCPSMVSSQIYTENGEGVANVLVELTANDVRDTAYTSTAGSYSLPPGFEIDSTLTVKPQKDSDYFNGVSTFDMILISKHIIGTSPLPTPYTMIAADVNNSGSITTLDLIQLRKLILGITNEFSNNTSWRFVSPNLVFSDPSNPWSGGDITDSSQPPWPADFVGIKIGDIDLSADPSSLQSSNAVVTREGTPFYLHTPAQALKAGQEYDIPVFASQLPLVDGFQGTLQLSLDTELISIQDGLISKDYFGPLQPDGTVAMSWVAPQQLPDEQQPLFTLNIRAKRHTALKDALGINHELLQSEAYGKDGQWRPVNFRFDQLASVSDRLQLKDSYPNPFRENTQIDFYLPEQRPARLIVHNATGQLLYTLELEGKSGWNSITLGQTLPKTATGELYYTLQVDEHRLTKSMIRLK